MEKPVCRTCLVASDGSIFKTVFLDGKPLSLVGMLNECTGLSVQKHLLHRFNTRTSTCDVSSLLTLMEHSYYVTESDGISLYICDVCTEEIINSYVYRKKCWDSHNFLLRRLVESQIDSVPKKLETAETTEFDECVTPVPIDIKYEAADFTRNVHVETPGKKMSHKGVVKCELCDTTFSHTKSLLQHLRYVHNILECQRYECKFCKKSLSSLSSLRRHIASIHVQPEEAVAPKFICHHCGQITKNRRNFILHVRRHTGEKPYKCDLCDYRSARYTDIISHKRIHTNERPFKCDICGKLFRTSSTRANHRKVHSEETPYECIVCLKKFKHRRIYTQHMNIHDPDKYIACKFCGKKFARQDNLNTHMKQHTHEKPHVCEFCGKGFIQKHCWQTHIKNNHNQ